MRRLAATLSLIALLAPAGCGNSSGPSIPNGATSTPPEVSTPTPGKPTAPKRRRGRGRQRTVTNAPTPATID